MSPGRTGVGWRFMSELKLRPPKLGKAPPTVRGRYIVQEKRQKQIPHRRSHTTRAFGMPTFRLYRTKKIGRKRKARALMGSRRGTWFGWELLGVYGD